MLIKDPYRTEFEALESAYVVTCDALDKAQHTIKDLEAKNQDLASENAALKEKLRLAQAMIFGE